jgi:hypothetical protein
VATRKKWSDLSPGTRRLIAVAAAVEGTLKAAALTDLARRPAGQVRGPRWAWAVVLVLVNAAGAVPLAYLRFGRRPPAGTSR